jgi:hypothetical protein
MQMRRKQQKHVAGYIAIAKQHTALRPAFLLNENLAADKRALLRIFCRNAARAVLENLTDSMRLKNWSLMTLFLILLALAVYLVLVVRRTADDPSRDVTIAAHVAIGCGVASVLALAIGVLILLRQRRRR